MNRPLVTFALVAYNQERFVREAVRGALAQTYSPLQVVISDDCSRDRTFEIIKEEVDGYDGPHQILLNRNERNLGSITGHLNRIMELAEGELIVAAAADDISLPGRTEEVVRAWSSGGVFSVYSNYYLVDENGADYVIAGERAVGRGATTENNELSPMETWQEMVRSGSTGVFGCAHAWDRAVFDVFGPLPNNALHEDIMIPFRSALLGKVAYVDKCLVKYRRHPTATMMWLDSNSWDLQQKIEYEAKQARSYRLEYETWLRDLQHFLSTHPERKTELLQATDSIVARVEFLEFKGSAAESGLVARLRNGFRAFGSAKELGVKQLLQVGSLSISPRGYYRVQEYYSRMKRLNRGVVVALRRINVRR